MAEFLARTSRSKPCIPYSVCHPPMALGGHIENRAGVGGGFDPLDVELGKFFDVGEDFVELPLEGRDFALAEIDPSEVRDVGNV